MKVNLGFQELLTWILQSLQPFNAILCHPIVQVKGCWLISTLRCRSFTLDDNHLACSITAVGITWMETTQLSTPATVSNRFCYLPEGAMLRRSHK